MTRTVVATADFTAADGTDLTSLGFTKIRDVAYGSSSQIKSNKAAGYYATAASGDTTTQTHTVQMVRTSGTYTDDQYAKATISGLGPNLGPDKRGGVIVRCSTDTDANADFYGVYVCDDDAGSGSTTVLFQVVNGTFTSIDSRRRTWANGDTIALEIASTTLTYYRNDVSLLSAGTSGGLTGGRPGLYIASYQGDSTILALDDWEGGNVASATFHARAYFDAHIAGIR